MSAHQPHLESGASTHTGGFARTATDELSAMQSFLGLLERERAALESGNADSLPEITRDKSALIEKLSCCAQQRARLLAVAGEQRNAAGMQQLIGTDRATGQLWDQLLEVAKRAAGINTGNAFLANQRLAHVERALNTIGAPRAALYGVGGRASYGSGISRSLAQG